ncbi:MAG TPA: outer membrane beta-barrel protein [Blastocatellia bacterium]|nr:outer membrane beta-barrel protein [Blastocatellia bacterium]
MRLVSPIAILLIALSTPARAQEPPRVEVFGGYSFLRFEGGGSLHGWNASVAINFNRYVGLATDFSGHYGSQSLTLVVSNPLFPGMITVKSDSDTSVHTLLTGPRLSYRKNERLTPFAHTLFGVSHLRTKAVSTVGDLSSEINFGDNAFTMAIGGGLDLKLSESIGLRLIQADYLLTRFGGGTQGNARISVGLVLH